MCARAPQRGHPPTAANAPPRPPSAGARPGPPRAHRADEGFATRASHRCKRRQGPPRPAGVPAAGAFFLRPLNGGAYAPWKRDDGLPAQSSSRAPRRAEPTGCAGALICGGRSRMWTTQVRGTPSSRSKREHAGRQARGTPSSSQARGPHGRRPAVSVIACRTTSHCRSRRFSPTNAHWGARGAAGSPRTGPHGREQEQTAAGAGAGRRRGTRAARRGARCSPDVPPPPLAACHAHLGGRHPARRRLGAGGRGRVRRRGINHGAYSGLGPAGSVRPGRRPWSGARRVRPSPAESRLPGLLRGRTRLGGGVTQTEELKLVVGGRPAGVGTPGLCGPSHP
jgi:hypothetical protein